MEKIYSKNKKAYHDYEVLETLEAGISLLGAEVKSIRKSNVQLKGSYILIKDSKISLISSHISRPDHIGNRKFDEYRERNLLIHKNQLEKLYKRVTEKGISLVPLKIYQPEDSKKIKVQIGLVKGKKDYDKRETLKRTQQEMDAKRDLKDY